MNEGRDDSINISEISKSVCYKSVRIMGLFNIFVSKTVKKDEAPKVEVPVVNKEYKLDPTLELERQLGEQIYNALQGNVVEEDLRQIQT